MAPSAISPPEQDAVASTTHGTAVQKKKTPLQMISQGTSLPCIPVHPTFAGHRQWTLEHMAIAFRVFARKGYTEGMSGHISVRDPEFPHTFWTNPLGRHFGLLKSSDMILVNYEAGKAWSTFARPLEMLNQDVTYFYGSAQSVYHEFGGVVFTVEEGERLAAALGPEGKGMILRNHGLITVGSTVDEAAYMYTLMERSCEVQLMVEAAAANGVKKVYVPEESAKYTFEMGSDPEALYWEFQPDLEYEEFMCQNAHKG
ncbi:hypothetical protein LTR27_012216 [Elasticomyces elasticus]|nr:hypothetical protein LTR27_012216 [Elasticomyces elasticus]